MPSARRATHAGDRKDPRSRISIHALREEGDEKVLRQLALVLISIHALREEGDNLVGVNLSSLQDFYPRPPRGGRPIEIIPITDKAQFLSTPSARRATAPLFRGRAAAPISIHALREEGDRTRQHLRLYVRNFYPRPPRGGRRRRSPLIPAPGEISIHALREEGDHHLSYDLNDCILFLSTPSARRATKHPGGVYGA